MLSYLIVWRSFWAILSQSWYVPDETWQSVEIAHKLVWGQGFSTWESDYAIRQCSHLNSTRDNTHFVIFQGKEIKIKTKKEKCKFHF